MEILTQYELPLDVEQFQVEELEERLENKWGSDTSCVCDRTNGQGETVQYVTSNCPCGPDPGPTPGEVAVPQQ